MPSVDYDARLVFDEHFYEKVIKKYPLLMTKLMYINSNSRGHKRRSNIMSKKIFIKILEKNKTMPRELLRASFYDISEEELEEIEDEIERTIKYAIHIVEETPRKSIILTSDDVVEIYSESSHYKDVKEISVLGGDDAVQLIEVYWKLCTDR